MANIRFELSDSLTSLLQFDCTDLDRKSQQLPKLDDLFFQVKHKVSANKKLELLRQYGQLELVDDDNTIKLFAHDQQEDVSTDFIIPVTESIYSEKYILKDRELSDVWIKEMISTKCEELKPLPSWKYNILQSKDQCFREVDEFSIRELLATHPSRVSAHLADEIDAYETISKDERLERIKVPTHYINWYKIVIQLFLEKKVCISLENLVDRDDPVVLLDLTSIGDVLLTQIQNVPCQPTLLSELMYSPVVSRIVYALKMVYLDENFGHHSEDHASGAGMVSMGKTTTVSPFLQTLLARQTSSCWWLDADDDDDAEFDFDSS
jgi:hypothetical protein